MYRIESGQQNTENNTISRFHKIQYTIRESLAIQGGLPPETQSKVDFVYNSYLNSEGCKTAQEHLYESLECLNPNRQKLEKSFKEGLYSNIKYSQTNPDLSHVPPEDIIQSFILHCQETAKNLKDNPDFNKGRKRNGVLYTIISCPRLYAPDTFNQLCRLIRPNGFVNTAVITSMIERKTPNINEVVVQKSKIFQQIITSSMVARSGLSIEKIKTTVIQNSNPVDFLEKKCADKKLEQPIRVNLDSLIRQLSRINEEFDILKDKVIPPKKIKEIIRLSTEIYQRSQKLNS